MGFTARANVFGPRFIESITGLLQYLFAPPLLLPMLALIIAAHVWMYTGHGLGTGIRTVLATPALLLIVVAIIAVSGIAHEFGHASALRYGGGKVRGMGVGLYLIYPAFYTDTTDTYRLGRWARVRTDLGGFYFHLIFALGLIGLYALTGYEFLLIAVFLINLDILYQCIPFFRLDGYYTLADLTGVPDFFSQMGPFLASVLPVKGWQGAKLPPLKPWVKTVFILYMLLTVPLLALLLFLFFTRAPQIITMIWTSLDSNAQVILDAQANGDILAMLASLAQMLILALPMLGILYMLYSLGWKPVRALWARRTPLYRLGAVLVAVGILCLLGFVWVPQFL